MMTESRYIDPEDEAFNEIERRSVAKKEAVRAVINKEKPMRNIYAFPVTHKWPYEMEETYNGMTMRDYFAAKAMQSYVSDKDFVDACVFMEKDVKEEIARVAYATADAMMKARES
jgi:hypothetical protein